MSKILKNNTGSAVALADTGQEVPASGQLTIDPADYSLFAKSDDTITKLADGTLTMNNGSVDLLLADATQYLQGGVNSVSVNEQTPFGAKKIGSKKLYTRTEGKKFTLTAGSNDCLFEIPYTQCKLDGIEVINGEALDQVDFQILDTDGDPTAPYYGTNNAVLNQFGFNVGVSKDFYRKESKYDADLLFHMQIKIIYESVSAKDIIVNYFLHELV